MEEKEIIKQLKQTFQIIAINIDLKTIYSLNSYILNLLDKLMKTNEVLYGSLTSYAINISSSSDIDQIHDNAKSALTELNKVEEKESGLLAYIKIIKTENYKNNVNKFKNMEKQIINTENKIKKAERYIKELHEKIKVGKYKDCLHARVNENIRIIYYVDQDTRRLFYITILNHNDLDNSFRIKPINWKEKFNEYF